MGDIEINFSYYTKTVTYYTKVPVVHRTKTRILFGYWSFSARSINRTAYQTAIWYNK